MEKILKQTILYDFYGELLTPHQRCVYEEAVYHDLSLSEIAQEHDISRQGVHDLIKRCNKILEGYEEKLHLVEKFLSNRDKLNEITELARVDIEAGKSEISEADKSGEQTAYLKERLNRIQELSSQMSAELMKE